MGQKVALALGSGGARGLAHIGVIRKLEEEGFSITSVSGSSMGSLVAGFYAMGRMADFSEWISSLKKRDVYSLMDITLSYSGLLKGDRVFNKMKEIIPDKPIEEMAIPYTAVATDIVNRREVVFSSGSFYDAARASIAIPAIITPITFGDKIYVDGGLLNPVPVNHVQRTDNDILVVVNLYADKLSDADQEASPEDQEKEKKHQSAGEKGKENSSQPMLHINSSIEYLQQKIHELIPKADTQNQGYLHLLQLTSSLMLTRISNLLMELKQPDIVIDIPADSAKTFDFHKASQLIAVGEKAAIRSMNAYRQKER
jgi:NTE family protein